MTVAPDTRFWAARGPGSCRKYPGLGFRSNLPFLLASSPEHGGQHRIWESPARQPRAYVPTSPIWQGGRPQQHRRPLSDSPFYWPAAQNMGVSTESGSHPPDNHVRTYQPLLSGREYPQRTRYCPEPRTAPSQRGPTTLTHRLRRATTAPRTLGSRLWSLSSSSTCPRRHLMFP
jgi:hypothetical protein